MGEKNLPIFVNDDGWSWDVAATQQLLPQIHIGVQMSFLKVTLGHLYIQRGREMLTRIVCVTIMCSHQHDIFVFVHVCTVIGPPRPCPGCDVYTDLIPDFPQPLTLMSSTTIALSGIVNPNSFR